MQEPNFGNVYNIRQSGNEAEHEFATYVYELRFSNDDTATLTATVNPNGSVTWRIEEVFHFFTTQPHEIEEMVALYEAEGVWGKEQKK